MKRYIFSISSLVFRIKLLAQTQYDYYDDEVAYQVPVIDGYTLLSLIIFTVIGFLIWIIYRLGKEWANKNIIAHSKPKEPKPKSQSEMRKEEIYNRKKAKELEWEAMVKEMLKNEAVEILKREYGEPHIMDGVMYVLKYDTLQQDYIDAFIKGYILGSFRHYSYLSLTEIKKRLHPVIVLGYIRGLQEKEIWKIYGKCPVWEDGYVLP